MVLYVHRSHKISGLLAIASLNQPELAAFSREMRSPKWFDHECKKREQLSQCDDHCGGLNLRVVMKIKNLMRTIEISTN